MPSNIQESANSFLKARQNLLYDFSKARYDIQKSKSE